MRLILNGILSFFIITPAFSDVCSELKSEIKTNFNDISWKITPVENFTEKKSESIHGTTKSSINYYSRLYSYIINTADGGYCLVLNQVDTSFGIPEFEVFIDKKIPKDSCIYNAIYNHELKHIKSDLSLIEDYKNEYYQIVKNLIYKQKPKYIKSENNVSDELDKISKYINESPEMINFIEKIQKEKKYKDSKIDPDIDTANKIIECKNQSL